MSGIGDGIGGAFYCRKFFACACGRLLSCPGQSGAGKRGLPNVQVHDTTQAIATTVDAIRLLIQEDKDADRL